MIRNKNTLLLGLAFFLIFLGFDGSQQYVTTFFNGEGTTNLGFVSLILIYLFFIIMNPLAAAFVTRYGTRSSMMIGALSYSLYMLSLLSGQTTFLVIASVVLGAGAALLWVGQNSYLIAISEREHYGARAGLFNVFRSLGSAIGVLLAGILTAFLPIRDLFGYFAPLPILGIVILFFLPRPEDPTSTQNQFKPFLAVITDVVLLRLAFIFFSTMFVHGLVLGVLPLHVDSLMGASFVGKLTFLFYIIPVVLSYRFGKISDRRGRALVIRFSFFLLLLGLLVLYVATSPMGLVGGIVLLSIAQAALGPIALALVGDISSNQNRNYIVSFFWMMRIGGIVSALLISLYIQDTRVYLGSAAIIFMTALITFPALSSTRKRIAY